MGQFTAVVQRYMSARNMSVRATASAAGYSDHTLLSKVLNGHKPVTPYLAAKLDRALKRPATRWSAPNKLWRILTETC